MAKLTLELNKVYKSRGGDKIHILTKVREAEMCYKAGFRFRDQNQECYMEDGHWSFNLKHKTDKDLVEELSS